MRSLFIGKYSLVDDSLRLSPRFAPRFRVGSPGGFSSTPPGRWLWILPSHVGRPRSEQNRKTVSAPALVGRRRALSYGPSGKNREGRRSIATVSDWNGPYS